MPADILDTENADRNLTSQVTVLTHTPDAGNPSLVQGYLKIGDGTKNLDGSGGLFEFTITIGSQTVQPDPVKIQFSSATRIMVWTAPLPVPANEAIVLKVKSPNAADTDVDVTAYLFGAEPAFALVWHRRNLLLMGVGLS